MLLTLFLILTTLPSSFAANETATDKGGQTHADAVISVFRLLQPESRTAVLQKNPKFSMKSCQKVPPDRWTRLLLLQEPVTYKTQFGPECDIQGNTIVKLSPFPVDVQLRNFEGVQKVMMTLTIQLTPQLSKGGIEVVFLASDGKLFPTSSAKNKKKISPQAFIGEYHSIYNLSGKLVQPPSGFLQFGTQKTDFSL